MTFSATSAPAPYRHDPARTLPASTGQRLLWAFERRLAQRGALNVPTVMRLPERLNRAAMDAAIAGLVARHEALRTVIRWQHRRLIRVVHDGMVPAVRYVDVSDAPAPAEAAQDLLARELTTDIDPAGWPMRATVWSLDGGDHLICLNVHHQATDAWSSQLVARDLASLYRTATGQEAGPLPAVGWQYSDFVEWQSAQIADSRHRRHLAYWEEQLAQACGPRLPSLGSDTAGDRVTGHDLSPLGAGVFEGLTALARRERTTLFSVVLAVSYAALARLTGQSDLAVTTLLSDRTRSQLMHTVGYFVSAVALRTRFHPEEGLASLVRRCRSTVFGAVEHQALPFHMLPPAITRQAQMRIDEVVVQVLGDPATMPPPFEPWARASEIGVGRTFDLEVVVQPLYDQWYVSVLFGLHRYDRSTMRALVDAFCDIAAAAVAVPDQPIGTLAAGPRPSGDDRDR